MQSALQRGFLLASMVVCTVFVAAALALIVFGGSVSGPDIAPSGYMLASADNAALPFITKPKGL